MQSEIPHSGNTRLGVIMESLSGEDEKNNDHWDEELSWISSKRDE